MDPKTKTILAYVGWAIAALVIIGVIIALIINTVIMPLTHSFGGPRPMCVDGRR